MSRSFRTEGIVLRNYRFGEIHKGVTFLSPEYGIQNAIAYGAYSAKGKLRSITNPLCTGTFFLYRDPVKDSIKISDLDCREFFEGIRSSIVKFFTASVWLETVLKTYGGEAKEVFALLSGSLRILSSAGEEASSWLLVQFLWRYLQLSGAAPDTNTCSACGCSSVDAAGLVYRRGSGSFFCQTCAGSRSGEQPLELSVKALSYLRYSQGIPLEKSLSICPDETSVSSLKKVFLYLVSDLAGGQLNSIRTGTGVL